MDSINSIFSFYVLSKSLHTRKINDYLDICSQLWYLFLIHSIWAINHHFQISSHLLTRCKCVVCNRYWNILIVQNAKYLPIRIFHKNPFWADFRFPKFQYRLNSGLPKFHIGGGRVVHFEAKTDCFKLFYFLFERTTDIWRDIWGNPAYNIYILTSHGLYSVHGTS